MLQAAVTLGCNVLAHRPSLLPLGFTAKVNDKYVYHVGPNVTAFLPNVGEAAEVLHRSFLKQLLGVRTCTANEIVLAEFGRFPLQVHFWQQILRYHHRDTRLVKLAMVDGCTLSSSQSVTAATTKGWQYYVGSFLEQHSQQNFSQF